MKNILDDIDFDVDCPNCGKDINIKIEDVGNTVTCPSCSESVLIEDDGSFAREAKKAKKAFADLDKTLKDFGKW